MTPPPVSKTQDDYSHHTSPVKGPQAVAPEVVTASKPGAKISEDAGSAEGEVQAYR